MIFVNGAADPVAARPAGAHRSDACRMQHGSCVRRAQGVWRSNQGNMSGPRTFARRAPPCWPFPSPGPTPRAVRPAHHHRRALHGGHRHRHRRAHDRRGAARALEPPVVVENKPGASGNIGTQYAATRRADGHTLMVTANTFVTNVSLFKSIPTIRRRASRRSRGGNGRAGAGRASLGAAPSGATPASHPKLKSGPHVAHLAMELFADLLAAGKHRFRDDAERAVERFPPGLAWQDS